MTMKLRLDRSGGVPLHEQLRDQIQAALHVGQLRPGDRLPSLREMARRHDVNPKTVLRAYRALAVLGLIEIRPGSGSLVGGEAIERRDEERAVRLLEMARRHRLEAERAGLKPEEHRLLLARLDPDGGSARGGPDGPRVVVLECNSEQARLFAREIARRLGVPAFPLVLPAKDPPSEAVLRMADLWVTTDFHAHEVRTRAAAHGRPCLALRLDPRFPEAILAAAARGSVLMIYSDLSVFSPFRRALANLGVPEKILGRIRGISGADPAEVDREVAKAASAYVSPLCDEAVVRRVPRHLLVQAPRWHLAAPSIEALRAMILALPTFARESGSARGPKRR
jgi:GntR family transcriptional regulator